MSYLYINPVINELQHKYKKMKNLWIALHYISSNDLNLLGNITMFSYMV